MVGYIAIAAQTRDQGSRALRDVPARVDYPHRLNPAL